jgi:hypothetical protein
VYIIEDTDTVANSVQPGAYCFPEASLIPAHSSPLRRVGHSLPQVRFPHARPARQAVKGHGPLWKKYKKVINGLWTVLGCVKAFRPSENAVSAGIAGYQLDPLGSPCIIFVS